MTLFNETNTPATPVVDENTDFLAQLVGEGKKFGDVAALAKGKAESDAFIARLQGELAGLREELTKRDRLGELIDRLEKPTAPTTPPAAETPPQPQSEGFDPSKLEDIVKRMLEGERQKTLAEQNLDTVKKTLEQRFGPGYGHHLKEKAAQLGVSTDFLDQTAKQSPTAFFNILGINSQASNGGGYTPPASQGRPSFEPANAQRDMAFYNKLKASDPSKYWSPAIQNQMHNDALKLGEKFFN